MNNTTLERAKQFVGDMPDGDLRLIESWVEKMAEFADKETAALKAKLDAVREIVAEYANPEAHIYVNENGKEIMRDDFGHVRAANALAIIDGKEGKHE